MISNKVDAQAIGAALAEMIEISESEPVASLAPYILEMQDAPREDATP